MVVLVCKWASERATRERNTSIRLGIGNSDGGEDTKEDGAEESGNEIHIEKAQGSRFGGGVKKSSGGFMVGLSHSEMDRRRAY